MKTEPCLICKKPVPDFVPQYCCSGMNCGCGGLPVNPCICSDECEDALYKYIGLPFDERRQKAGIALFTAAQPEDKG